jgi:hypothetical protein
LHQRRGDEFQAGIEHDPEKWIPVSRLREAPAIVCRFIHASAGEGRSGEIMLKQKYEAK